MQPNHILGALILALLSLVPSLRAQESKIEASPCELARNPESFDRKLIQVRGTLNVFFEDFSLNIHGCDDRTGIWLAFGGDVPGIVASLVNDIVRKPGSKLNVDGVSLGVTKDNNFRRLYALIASTHAGWPNYSVTATLTGMFFAKKAIKNPQGGFSIDRYGHMGCCSLLVIASVSDVDSVPPASLHLEGTVIGPDDKPAPGITVVNDVQGGSPPEEQTAVTNESGAFSFSNSGQRLRIEDPHYRPLAIAVEPDRAPIRVKLENANQSDWILPRCEASRPHHQTGFAVRFTVPGTMKTSRIEPDLANQFNDFLFVHKKGTGLGTAGLGIWRIRDRSSDPHTPIDFEGAEERWIKGDTGNVVGMDARSLSDRGEFRRQTIFYRRESATYSLKSRDDATILDQILDSACSASLPKAH
jgi:hypothetical protein